LTNTILDEDSEAADPPVGPQPDAGAAQNLSRESRRRIMLEMRNLMSNPHPGFDVYPSEQGR